MLPNHETKCGSYPILLFLGESQTPLLHPVSPGPGAPGAHGPEDTQPELLWALWKVPTAHPMGCIPAGAEQGEAG